MSIEIPAEILARLKHASETGNLGGLGIDCWDRGGPPGQGYEANLLLEQPGGETLKQTRFDMVYEPPFRVEEYVGPALDGAAVRKLAELALKAFEGTFTEDLDPRIGGVTKLSIKAYVIASPAIAGGALAVGGGPAAGVAAASGGANAAVDPAVPEAMKTFYQQWPAELAELGELMAARTAVLTAKPPRILSKPAP